MVQTVRKQGCAVMIPYIMQLHSATLAMEPMCKGVTLFPICGGICMMCFPVFRNQSLHASNTIYYHYLHSLLFSGKLLDKLIMQCEITVYIYSRHWQCVWPMCCMIRRGCVGGYSRWQIILREEACKATLKSWWTQPQPMLDHIKLVVNISNRQFIFHFSYSI